MWVKHFSHGDHRANYFTTYRKGDWKLIYYYHPETLNSPSCKLYKLKKDPYEASDLANEYPEQVVRMIRMMKERLEKEDALYPTNTNILL